MSEYFQIINELIEKLKSLKELDNGEILGHIQDMLIGSKEPETKAAQVMSEYPPIKNKELDERLGDIFLTIGIPANIKGYAYLRDSVKLCITYPTEMSGVTKNLYPTIARHHNSTSSKVERAIRHAIDVARKRHLEKLNEIFNVPLIPDKKYKPSNGEFIWFLADKLLIQGVG